MREKRLTAENRRAYHDYEILETLEAGLVLTGAEVKAAKAGSLSFRGSFVHFLQGRPVVIGLHIGPYPKAGKKDLYNPKRTRYLLLNQAEIKRLLGAQSQKGVALVPLKIYLKNDRLKLEIGVGRGKKKYDKREALKSRELEREVERGMTGVDRELI